MEIKEFQEKLADICKLAAENGKKISGEQIRQALGEMELVQEQLVLIFRYLKSQGIQVEGFEASEEEKSVVADEKEDKENAEEKENPCLTEEDKEYLKSYLESLKEYGGTDPRMTKYMPLVAQFSAEMYRDGMNLADLIQDANLALLTILADGAKDKSDAEIITLLRKGVKEAVDAQDEQNFEDDCLVAKVQNLDSVMKELTDGEEGDPKFSLEELAIMLDMDIDEMQDIIRLTGDM